MASSKTKHIDIKHHYRPWLVDANKALVAVVSMSMADMLAYGLTNALPELKHTMIFRRCMGAAVSVGYFVDITTNDLEGYYSIAGARRQRSGGGLGGGCARWPVGTYLYLHAVGAGDHVAVPGLAR
jgi:hypothetical protein